MFTSGQRVVCVDSKGTFNTGRKMPLQEGRKYTIADPNYKTPFLTLHVAVTLIEVPGFVLSQLRFVPEDFDQYADNEFHQALKGIP